VNGVRDGDCPPTRKLSRLGALFLGQDAAVFAALVLTGLVLAAGTSRMFGTRGAVTLAVLSVLWLLVNAPMEGPVLLTVASGHGLTGGDLAGLTGLVLAAVQARSLVRRPDRRT
jgi:hypothetical protein